MNSERLPLEGYGVAVIGLGVMGRGIARVFTEAGADVLATDATPELLTANRTRLEEEASADGGHGLPRTVDSLAVCVAGANLVLEAVSEDPDVKKSLLTELGELLGDEVVLATNTSSLSVSDLGRQFGRPERVVGMHFFNPATKMRLIEIVRGALTAPEVVDEALRLCAALGKNGALCVDSPGFVVNRCCRPLYYESQILVSHGAEAAAIDVLARRALGHRVGPLETLDVAGLHTHLTASETALREFGDPRYRPVPLVRRMVRAGLLGRSTGRGFYDYSVEKPRAARTRVQVLPDHEPVRIGVAGPETDRLAPLLGEHHATGDTDLVVYATATACDDDVAAVADLATRGPVIVDSADGGWITRLPAGADWVHTHELAGEVTLEVVHDEVARIKPTAQVGALAAALQGVRVAVPALPGLVVERLGNVVANEATSLVEEGIATADAVDTALVSGMNHSRGPFTYMAGATAQRVLLGLRRLQEITGDDRYRPTTYLIRLVAGELRRQETTV